MNINKVSHNAIGLLVSLAVAFYLGAANAEVIDDGQSYVHEEVSIELLRAVSPRGFAGKIRVRQPSEMNCSLCGEDLEIDENTRLISLPSGEVIDIKLLSQHLPASGQVDVAKVDLSRDGSAKTIKLYK